MYYLDVFVMLYRFYKINMCKCMTALSMLMY